MDDNDIPKSDQKTSGSPDAPETLRHEKLKLSEARVKALTDLPPGVREALKTVDVVANSPTLKALQTIDGPVAQALKRVELTETVSRAIDRQNAQAAFAAEAVDKIRRDGERIVAVLNAFTQPSTAAVARLSELGRFETTALDVSRVLERYYPAIGSIADSLNTFYKGMSNLTLLAAREASGIARTVAAVSELASRAREPLERYSAVAKLINEALEASSRAHSATARVEAAQASLKGLGATGGLLTALIAASASNAIFLKPMSDAAVVASEALAVVPNSPALPQARAESSVVDAVAAFSELSFEDRSSPEQFVAAVNRIVDVRVQELQARPSRANLLHFLSFMGWLIAWLVPTLVTIYIYEQQSQAATAEQRAISDAQQMLQPLTEALQRHQNEFKAISAVVCVAEKAANIREAPGTESRITGKMRNGQNAAVIGAAKGWRQVEYVEPLTGRTMTGWVAARLLKSVTLLAPEADD